MGNDVHLPPTHARVFDGQGRALGACFADGLDGARL